MVKKIINLVTATSIGLLLFNVVALSAPIYADAAATSGATYGLFADSAGDACDGLSQLNDPNDKSPNVTCGNNQGQSKIESFAGNIVNAISIIAGIIAVIMIIVAGIRYIASGGDSNAVSSAKSALVYALIGIAIAALAQVLVHFVLSATANNPPPPSS